MKVTINAGGETRTAACCPGDTLANAIRRAGFAFPMPCGGNHTCGKCRVSVSGRIPPPDEEEQRLLSKAEGMRLACFAQAADGCEITLPEHGIQVLGAENLPPAPYDDFQPGQLGFAVDIGTTTAAVYLYDMHRRALLAQTGEQNSQCAFGADVISRIDYSIAHGGEILQAQILRQLAELFKTCLDRAGEAAGSVKYLVITGNTTMLHFLTGKDPRGIAAAPFEAESYFGFEMDAGLLFPAFSGAVLYLPACVRSYVGADIICAMTAVGLRDRAVLLDVGTNGEMALRYAGKTLCCAAAAGPAFEGAGISMGMTASPGAVVRVWLENGTLRWETVDAAPAAGVCGTGILSILRLLRETGALDETGLLVQEGPLAQYVTEGERFRLGDSGIAVTQADVRAVQLAKAAIAAGLASLLHEAEFPRISVLYLCGGFGSRIAVEDAAAVGLIPADLAGCAVPAGNAAGTGAAMLLLSSALRRESEQLAREAAELSLSESAYFMEQYLEQMIFPPVDGSRGI